MATVVRRDVVGGVKVYHPHKRFGFLRVPGQDKDVFIHISDVEGLNGLSPDHYLRFDLAETERGFRALNATKIRWKMGKRGIIRRYNPSTGRGVIRSNETSREDTPFSIEDLQGFKNPRFGWTVEFDYEEGMARNIVVTDNTQFKKQPGRDEPFKKDQSVDDLRSRIQKHPSGKGKARKPHLKENTKKSGRKRRGQYIWKGDRLIRRDDG